MRGVKNKKIQDIMDDMITRRLCNKKIDNSAGFMAFHIDYLGKRENGWRFSFSHYYEQNGDLGADPDMEVLYINGELYPYSYQDTFGYQQSVEFDKADVIMNIDFKRQKQQAEFLGVWLRNVVRQQNL